jgi:hypothetical protein
MRSIFAVLLVLLFLCGAVFTGSRAESNNIKGDYVEVRTASVFAGACHYNGELTTAGREALMAWNVASGAWEGVDLAGLRAIAVVSAVANLADSKAARHSELIVDESASYAQTVALSKALKSRYQAALGEVVVVRNAPLSFEHQGKGYSVSSPALVAIEAEAMPDDLCCKMPQLVWYEPFVPLIQRKVGYTGKAFYAGGAVGDSWQRTGENSAFYGSFSF